MVIDATVLQVGVFEALRLRAVSRQYKDNK